MGDPPGGGGSPQPNSDKINFYKDSVSYDHFKVIFECKPTSSSTSDIPNIDDDSTSAPNKPNFPYLSKFKVGQFVSSVLLDEVLDFQRLSRSKILLSCKSAKSANEIITKIPSDASFKAYIPAAYLFKYGILRDVDTDFSNEDILNNIDAKNFHVVAIQRLNRRIMVDNAPKYIPSTTVKILFEGQFLPSFVYLFHVKGEIEAYMQPVIQCFKCFRYGHVNSRCKSSVQKCRNCASTISDSIDKHGCANSSPCCINCNAAHSATNKDQCPEYTRQCQIKRIMLAQPVCFQEASLFYPKNPSSKSFSSRLSQSKRDFPELPSVSKEVSSIPALVIPISSSPVNITSPHTNPSSFVIQHKRRSTNVNPPRAKKRLQVSLPDPMLDFNFNSPIMKNQLFDNVQLPGKNGVCLNPNPNTVSHCFPSGSSNCNTSNVFDHQYASQFELGKNKNLQLNLPSIQFSQSQTNPPSNVMDNFMDLVDSSYQTLVQNSGNPTNPSLSPDSEVIK
uniref:CCHC-type domain-containing protein n=1 Tax=Cacopsylla melanoneura TaxID=428564 RepID=A0A8D9F1D8_9HEMI